MLRDIKKESWLNIVAILLFLFLPHYWPIPFFTYAPVCFLLLIWLLRRQGESLASIGFSFSRFSWKTIPIGIFFAAGWTLVFRYGIEPLFKNIFHLKDADVSAFYFIRKSPVAYLCIVVAGWVIGGWYEEIIFRGFIHNRVMRFFSGSKSSFAIAAVFTSFVFGLYHIQQGMSGVIHAALFSAIPIYLMYRYKGNLWYGMLFHAMYDTIGLSWIFFSR
jgi:membrane protease YdiL (CAAX protease family)